MGTLPTTSRSGWNFLGWFTAASGGDKISISTQMPLNGATYYAHWSDTTPPTISSVTATAKSATSYTLTIKASDGTGSGIAGYYISTSSTKPAANATGWKSSTLTTFDATGYAPGTTIYSTGTLTVSNGTIDCSANGVHAIQTSSSKASSISGGTITSRNGDYSALCHDGSGTTTVSGSAKITNTAGPAVTMYEGTLKISGGTMYSAGGNATVRNGDEGARVGLVWINGNANIYTTGSGPAISNSSNSKWPTASKSGYIHACTATGCSMHVGGNAKISAKGTGYGARLMPNSSGNIHSPQAFTGYIHSKDNYVLHNAGTGKIVINGGNLYAQKGSSYFKGGSNKANITIKSTVKQYTKAP